MYEGKAFIIGFWKVIFIIILHCWFAFSIIKTPRVSPAGQWRNICLETSFCNVVLQIYEFCKVPKICDASYSRPSSALKGRHIFRSSLKMRHIPFLCFSFFSFLVQVNAARSSNASISCWLVRREERDEGIFFNRKSLVRISSLTLIESRFAGLCSLFLILIVLSLFLSLSFSSLCLSLSFYFSFSFSSLSLSVSLLLCFCLFLTALSLCLVLIHISLSISLSLSLNLNLIALSFSLSLSLTFYYFSLDISFIFLSLIHPLSLQSLSLLVSLFSCLYFWFWPNLAGHTFSFPLFAKLTLA